MMCQEIEQIVRIYDGFLSCFRMQLAAVTHSHCVTSVFLILLYWRQTNMDPSQLCTSPFVAGDVSAVRATIRAATGNSS